MMREQNKKRINELTRATIERNERVLEKENNKEKVWQPTLGRNDKLK
jgi:hypothetical protein